jgi:hypothetical protein
MKKQDFLDDPATASLSHHRLSPRLLFLTCPGGIFFCGFPEVILSFETFLSPSMAKAE